jgi:hypothetical protein
MFCKGTVPVVTKINGSCFRSSRQNQTRSEPEGDQFALPCTAYHQAFEKRPSPLSTVFAEIP